MSKKLCKVWIDMRVGDDQKACRKGIATVNMEHEQISAYLGKVLEKGFPYNSMTINIKDLGSLPETPEPVLFTGSPLSFNDVDVD